MLSEKTKKNCLDYAEALSMEQLKNTLILKNIYDKNNVNDKSQNVEIVRDIKNES